MTSDIGMDVDELRWIYKQEPGEMTKKAPLEFIERGCINQTKTDKSPTVVAAKLSRTAPVTTIMAESKPEADDGRRGIVRSGVESRSGHINRRLLNIHGLLHHIGGGGGSVNRGCRCDRRRGNCGRICDDLLRLLLNHHWLRRQIHHLGLLHENRG